MSEIGLTTVNKDDFLKLKFDKIYVKEISCKMPYAPNIFESEDFKHFISQSFAPQMKISIKNQQVTENKHEVSLYLIITCDFKGLNILTLEIEQSGIFEFKNATAIELEYIIKNVCPSLLHPYLSQIVTTLLVQVGFPPVVLQPLQPIIDKKIIENQLIN